MPGPPCDDPSLDVVESGYDVGPEMTTLVIRFVNADAPHRCVGPQEVPQRKVLHTFHLYVDDARNSGAYLLWALDEHPGDGPYVSVSGPGHGSGDVAFEETLVGDTLTLTVPTNGTMRTPSGALVSYSLDGKASYFGCTRGWYGVRASPVRDTTATTYAGLEDRFGQRHL